MDNTIPTTEDTTPDAPDAPQELDTAEADHDHPEVRKARQEAQNLRRRLRESEASRDTVNTALESMRTSEVLRLAGGHLADGRDLLALGGVTVADLLGDDGTVDPGRVRAAVDGLLTDRPHLAARPKPKSLRPVESLQPGSGRTQDLGTPGPTWGQALSGR